jgi:outer membrane receptor protein involved in Fe transport
LAITAGLRYQHDYQDRVGQVGPIGRGITLDYNKAFHGWLPKIAVAYDVGSDATIGLLVQRAYNPGGTTVNLATRRQDDFDAEFLWNYEVFARASFGQGRGTLSVNLFYNDMKNAQRPQSIEFIGPNGLPFTTTQIDNAPSAESYGAEVELGWRASNRLTLRLGLGLLRTRILETVVRSDPIRGKEFQRSPGFSAAASVDWRPIDPLRLSAQLRTNSDYYSDDADTVSRRIDGSATLNARAAYTVGALTMFGYAKNVFNRFYLTYLFNPPTLGTAGDPREVGLGIEARF